MDNNGIVRKAVGRLQNGR